jgi:hypothetical protein
MSEINLNAPYLTVDAPFKTNISRQLYYSCSMLTPNIYPLDHRNKYKDMEVYGFKVYAVYDSEEVGRNHVKELEQIHSNIEIFLHEVGILTEFDVDIGDPNRTSVIVYADERQNEIANDVFKKPIIEKKPEENTPATLYTAEEISKCLESENVWENDNIMVHKITNPLFACVSFYTPEMFGKTLEDYNGKRIIAHKMHGAFDNMNNAIKFANSDKIKKNNPAVFSIEMCKWGTIWANYKKNFTDNTMDALMFKINKLNGYMKDYEECIDKANEEMQKRKNESLKGKEVVTEKYAFLKENNGLGHIPVDDIHIEEKTDEMRDKMKVINREKREMEERVKMKNDNPEVFKSNLNILKSKFLELTE